MRAQSQRSILSRASRRAVSLIEMGVALSVMAVAMLVVMEVAHLSLKQRARQHARQIAIELAANVLEAARAEPWESLTQDWARLQAIPDSLRNELPDSELIVAVEPFENSARLRRIKVILRTRLSSGIEVDDATLTALLSDRVGAAEGSP